jgi:hypothetical protein
MTLPAPYAETRRAERWTPFWRALAEAHAQYIRHVHLSGDAARPLFSMLPPATRPFPVYARNDENIPVVFRIFQLMGLEGLTEAVRLGASLFVEDNHANTLLCDVETAGEFNTLVGWGFDPLHLTANGQAVIESLLGHPEVIQAALGWGLDPETVLPSGLNLLGRLEAKKTSIASALPWFSSSFEKTRCVLEAHVLQKNLQKDLPESLPSPAVVTPTRRI